MKIVVNTRLLRKNQMDGIGWFTCNTMRHIVQKNPDVEFHFLFDSPIAPEFIFASNVVPHLIFPPAKHALLNIIWFEWSVKRVLQRINPQLFFSPDGILCLGWKGKQHGVIHDLNFFHHPADLKFTNRKYYNYFFPRYARRAAGLATVSEYSKQDIVNTFKVPAEKIDVVYNGINTFFAPVTSQQQLATKSRLTDGKDYFLFVGALHPRKNIIRLLAAFDLFKQESGSAVKLIIGGKASYKANELNTYHQQMMYKNDVSFIGRVPDEQINDVLASALALVFVPHFEGFGIPVIEAMQCDVPVICSNTTAMPEVAGDAALLVNPFDVEAIKTAMVKVYSDPALRNDLIEKGRRQKLLFSWEKTADALWNSMQKCM